MHKAAISFGVTLYLPAACDVLATAELPEELPCVTGEVEQYVRMPLGLLEETFCQFGSLLESPRC